MIHCVTDKHPCTALYLVLQTSPGARHTCAVFLDVSLTTSDNWIGLCQHMVSQHEGRIVSGSRVRLVQAKYEHAVAAAQKSLIKDNHVSEVDEDDEDDSDQDQGADLLHAKKKKKKRKDRPEVSAADRAGKAAGHIQSVLKVAAPTDQNETHKKPKSCRSTVPTHDISFALSRFETYTEAHTDIN